MSIVVQINRNSNSKNRYRQTAGSIKSTETRLSKTPCCIDSTKEKLTDKARRTKKGRENALCIRAYDQGITKSYKAVPVFRGALATGMGCIARRAFRACFKVSDKAIHSTVQALETILENET